MFLGLYPELAIVTNIEHDHPDCFPTGEDYFDAFLDFVANLSPDGKLLVCADDPGGARLLSQKQIIRGATFTYGISSQPGIQPDYQPLGLQLNANGFFEFNAAYQGQKLAHVRLAVPGEHNVRNSLAALSVAHLYSLPIEKAAKALSEYSGTHRRFEIRGEVNGVTVVDDYAHHPSEIRATLAAAKQRFAGRQLWAVWQPHTFSRTREYYDAFASAFGDADHVIVTDIFAAREVPDSSLSANALVAKMKHTDASHIPDIRAATEYLLDRLQSRDVLLVLSAGDAEKISGWVLEGLSEDGRKRDA
jgi:UDP-N-acetylmuramate--alanine ligase